LSSKKLSFRKLSWICAINGKAENYKKISMITEGQTIFLISIFAGIAVGTVGTFLVLYRKQSRQVTEALIASRNLTEALDAQLVALSTRCGQLEDERDRALEAEKKQRGLAELHIEKNTQFDQQARKAWQIHQEYGLRAGNAQAWLFRELENAVRLINSYRVKENLKPVEVNPQLVSFISEIKREQENNVEMYAPK
jgi:hypothetical protein